MKVIYVYNRFQEKGNYGSLVDNYVPLSEIDDRIIIDGDKKFQPFNDHVTLDENGEGPLTFLPEAQSIDLSAYLTKRDTVSD